MDSPLQFARANVERIVAARLPRSVRAKALAELIRSLRSYRWVGIYGSEQEFVEAQ
jgi:hypothetical protein